MNKERPDNVYLTVVRSSSDPDTLSLRAWSEVKGRLSADELRQRLVDAGFADGDAVCLSFVGRSSS